MFDTNAMQLLQGEIGTMGAIGLGDVVEPLNDLQPFQVGQLQVPRPSDIFLEPSASAQAIPKERNVVAFVDREEFANDHALETILPTAYSDTRDTTDPASGNKGQRAICLPR